ncbi:MULTISPECIES: Hint domain-containing protein [unclassified Pseudomonas]
MGFKDWITSPIPSHTLEKQFDKVATASAQELGGIAFDAATGLVTAYIGGRAVEWVGEKWVSAKGTAGTPVTKGPCCFAAGTKVSTPQGDRVIESLKVGDVVWSKPEKGGKPFAAAILATHQRSDQPIYRLKLKSVRGAGAAEGETLLVTPSHPFYVPAKHDFIPVKDLEPGDLLQSLADGDTENTSSEVESLELYLPEGKTYNLTVDVGHTFYVGELKTWVHNTGPCDLPPDYFAGGAKGAVIPKGFSSADDFVRFGTNTRDGLARAGYENVEPILQGSAVTGKSFKTGEAFDVGRVSDFDVALASPELLQRAQSLGIGLRSGGTRTGPLSARDLQALGLKDLSSKMSAQAGREVNFMIYDSAVTAASRAPSAVLPK